jgi:hypothetical protein
MFHILSYIKTIPIPKQVLKFISNQYRYDFILADTNTYNRYQYQLYQFSQLLVEPYLYICESSVTYCDCDYWIPIITKIIRFLKLRRKLSFNQPDSAKKCGSW